MLRWQVVGLTLLPLVPVLCRGGREAAAWRQPRAASDGSRAGAQLAADGGFATLRDGTQRGVAVLAA